MNNLVLLYGVADFYARHLKANAIIDVIGGEIKFLTPKNRLSKPDKKILDDFLKIMHHLGKLDDTAYNTIKNKWFNILEGLKNYKKAEAYAAVIVGLDLLFAYAEKNINFIHPNRIQKILTLMKKVAIIDDEKQREFKYTDELILNSFLFSKKILQQLGV